MSELLLTIEQLRSEHFPEIPASLVESILAVEASSVRDRSKAGKEISALLIAHLEKGSSDAQAE